MIILTIYRSKTPKNESHNCLGLLLLIVHPILSQTDNGIGIGTLSPHPSAILHIYSPNKEQGVLMPNTSPSKLVTNSSTAEDGLIMYDSVHHKLVYFNNNAWNFVTPWVTDVVDAGSVDFISSEFNVGIGTTEAPSEALEVVGNIEVSGTISGYGTVPLGGIIMWSGNSGEVPSGYVLCNGQISNGRQTPDLVGRFIRGGSGTDATGGSDNMATSNISYQRRQEYIIDESVGCSSVPYLWSGEALIAGSCAQSGTYVSFSNIPATTCLQAAQTYAYDNLPFTCGVQTTRNCSSTSNPNYYLNNGDCYTPNVEEFDVVTSTDNKPAYYQLAFIMRVR